ncbi:MAG: hypothetical protein NC132_04395 [Corallococcus sp.]|nr:hypothetical protein [Corallococcus sp.]MCM1359900.1 hypothetical protein [Corallococcus sp.]MCM1395334.1 hypothetical protein [Corallococcus sp.]
MSGHKQTYAAVFSGKEEGVDVHMENNGFVIMDGTADSFKVYHEFKMTYSGADGKHSQEYSAWGDYANDKIYVNEIRDGTETREAFTGIESQNWRLWGGSSALISPNPSPDVDGFRALTYMLLETESVKIYINDSKYILEAVVDGMTYTVELEFGQYSFSCRVSLPYGEGSGDGNYSLIGTTKFYCVITLSAESVTFPDVSDYTEE